jgi:hypothetical protein
MAKTYLQSLVQLVAGSIRGNVAGLEGKDCVAMGQTLAFLSLPRHPLPSEPADTGMRPNRGYHATAAFRAGRLARGTGVRGSRSLAFWARARSWGKRSPGFIHFSGLFFSTSRGVKGRWFEGTNNQRNSTRFESMTRQQSMSDSPRA